MLPLVTDQATSGGDHRLTLNTGRLRDQWHTMTRTGRVTQLQTHVPAPRLAIHPGDAAKRGLKNAGLARIDSADGSAVLRIVTDGGLRPGDVFVPMHWTDQFASSGPVDRLVHAVVDPVSGQPDLKGTKVQVACITENWRAMLLRRQAGVPLAAGGIHWSRTQIAAGFAYELSGCAPLEEMIDSEDTVRDLLKAPATAEIIVYSDPKRSVYRYAGIAEGRLQAAVFFGPSGAEFPEAEYASRLLAQELSSIARIAVLAGLEAGVSITGKIVCSCFSVGEAAICRTIEAEKLTTTAEIGVMLHAGTNCGSCIPELKKLLAQQAEPLPSVA
jgi:assimilatory nitrate reductase catalytic subunit